MCIVFNMILKTFIDEMEKILTVKKRRAFTGTRSEESRLG